MFNAAVRPRFGQISPSESVLYTQVNADSAHVYIPALLGIGGLPITDVNGSLPNANRKEPEGPPSNLETRRHRNPHIHSSLDGKVL